MKPPACLEYLVVHEMTHILESSHNLRFKALMGQVLSKVETGPGRTEQAADTAVGGKYSLSGYTHQSFLITDQLN